MNTDHFSLNINLHDYDVVIINTSAGKDSLVAIHQLSQLAKLQNYPKNKIHLSHQDLGRMEWPGTRELAELQAKHFGFEIHFSKRRTKDGVEETLLDYVLRRGKWPANKERYCTSDFKRGPGARVVTAITKDMQNSKVLHVFGFRKDESSARKKKDVLKINTKLTTQKRSVYDYLPVHDWTTQYVWQVIKENALPYHFAYGFGMPRLSCPFCIFSPFEALVIAGYNNPELLDEYIAVQTTIGHLFRNKFSLQEVKDAIESGYKPKSISNWIM